MQAVQAATARMGGVDPPFNVTNVRIAPLPIVPSKLNTLKMHNYGQSITRELASGEHVDRVLLF